MKTGGKCDPCSREKQCRVVKKMKENADKYDLDKEVRGEYLRFRKSDCPCEAAWWAQYEWDI